MKINDETPRNGDRYHRCRPEKKGVIAACALLLTYASAALAADVTFIRSMETSQIEPFSYVLTCTLEYTGVDPNHTYDPANLFASVPGIGTTGGEVGPHDRTFTIDEPGVTRFEAALRGHRLSMERIVYFEGAVPAGTSLTCQGGARDLTTSEIFPASLMTDVFR